MPPRRVAARLEGTAREASDDAATGKVLDVTIEDVASWHIGEADGTGGCRGWRKASCQGGGGRGGEASGDGTLHLGITCKGGWAVAVARWAAGRGSNRGASSRWGLARRWGGAG